MVAVLILAGGGGRKGLDSGAGLGDGWGLFQTPTLLCLCPKNLLF